MPQVTVKKFSEMDGVFDGMIRRARAELGVTSFGLQVMTLPAGWQDYPEHDESGSGQEEVYVPLSGSATLESGGQSFALEPGLMAGVPCGVKRKVLPGPEGIQMLVIGGLPGKAFQPQPWTEIGAPGPNLS